MTNTRIKQTVKNLRILEKRPEVGKMLSKLFKLEYFPPASRRQECRLRAFTELGTAGNFRSRNRPAGVLILIYFDRFSCKTKKEFNEKPRRTNAEIVPCPSNSRTHLEITTYPASARARYTVVQRECMYFYAARTEAFARPSS